MHYLKNDISMMDYKFGESCKIKTSYRCPVFHELFVTAAKTVLAPLSYLLLNMPHTHIHTQQNRGLRKLILQCRRQGKISINCKDFWQSIDVEKFVRDPNSCPVRFFVLALHENEGRGECGVQCGGTDDVQERQTLFVCHVGEIQD